MKMIKATNEKDITLSGVTVSLQQVDGKIEAVVITDASGKYIRIVKDGTYSDHLKVLIEEPKEYATVYKLTVKIDDGVSIYKLDSMDAVKSKVQFLNDDDYTVEEIQVEVTKDLNNLKQNADLDQIPF